MSGRDLNVLYTCIYRVSQHVHIHSWTFWRLKNYTAATKIENTMGTVHKSNKTCSVPFCKKIINEVRPYVK